MARILVIDESVQIRDVLRTVLERVGYEVVEAGDGNEGLAFFISAFKNKNPFDVVVTNIIMPEKGGIDTIMDLRREFPNCKIIAIAGGGVLEGETLPEKSVSYLDVALGVGADRSIGKPFVLDDFLEAVEDLISEREKERRTHVVQP